MRAGPGNGRPSRHGAFALAVLLMVSCSRSATGPGSPTTSTAPPTTITAPPAPPTTQGPPALPASLVGAEWTRLPTTAMVVALTFDAGANDAGVASILATLEETGTPATFFLTGHWAQYYPGVARQIGALYPVGDHTWTHPHLTALPDAQVRQQVTMGAQLIEAVTGRPTRPLFRFPYGASDARTVGVVNALGYGSIRWTVDTLGWMGTSGGRSVRSEVNRVLAHLGPGEIVLMHVGSNPRDRSTLDADSLPAIIAAVAERGYRFVTIPQFMRSLSSAAGG